MTPRPSRVTQPTSLTRLSLSKRRDIKLMRCALSRILNLQGLILGVLLAQSQTTQPQPLKNQLLEF